MSKDSVLYEVQDGVGRITLNRPQALNALDLATIRRLREVVTVAATSLDVRAVLLAGNGPAFCAGGDVKLMLSLASAEDDAREAAMLAGVGELHPVIADLCGMPKPVVAAVHGAAAGAGVGLALAADVTWAARSASFKLAFTALGVSPDSGTTFLLPRAVGPKLAAELFLTNRRLSADEALAAGLASRVLDDDELLGAARELAARLARGPTLAYARVRSLLRTIPDRLETQLEHERRNVGLSARSADFVEGLRAFVEKRPPEFRGK